MSKELRIYIKHRLPAISVTFILVTALYERDLKLAVISTLTSIVAYIIIVNSLTDVNGEDNI